MLAVLPALAGGPKADWSVFHDNPTYRAEFEAGLAFPNSNRTTIFDLVCLSRLTGIAWSVLGGWLIWRWTRELHGGPGIAIYIYRVTPEEADAARSRMGLPPLFGTPGR